MSEQEQARLERHLDGARQEVAWFFGGAATDMGYTSPGLEAGGERVFDEEASCRKHEAKLKERHRQQVQKHARVLATLGTLERQFFVDLRAVYTPFGVKRVEGNSTIKVLTRDQRVLIGLVLMTEAAHISFARKFSTTVRPPQLVLLQYLDSELGNLPNKALPQNHRLRAALDEADRRETVAATAYAALRAEALKQKRQREHDDLHVEAARLARRLGLSR